MSTATINISLPETMKSDIEKIIASEGYGNTSEFFRDLVRGYINRNRQQRLEALILEGLNSGPATPLTKKDFDDIRKVVMERHEARQKAK